MQALVMEIWMYMAGAGVVCGAVVWILGRFRSRAQIGRVEKTWQTRLRTAEDSLTSDLRSAEQNFSSQLDQKTAQIALLGTDYESQKGQRLALADELAKWKSDMADLLEEQDLMSAKLRRMDERLAVALEDADQLDLEVKRLTGEVGELEHEAESYKLRAHLLEPLEEQVGLLEGALREKERRIAELRSLEDQVSERDASLEMLGSEHQADLERRDREATRLRARIGELEPLTVRLQAELGSAKEARTLLEAELARLRSGRPGGNGVSDSRDDLKKIAGVGPVLERTLNGLGVRTYRQIASWNETEIQRVADRLEGFHDRIRRDDWVGQARRLHLEAYGEYI